jgi:hypothetical protein
MYWQSLWFRCPAADSSARGIFLFDRNRSRKLMTKLHVNEPLTAATALKAERERKKAQALRAARRRAQTIQCASLGYHLEQWT